MSTSRNASTRCTTSHVSPGRSDARRMRSSAAGRSASGGPTQTSRARSLAPDDDEVTNAAPARPPAPLLPNTARFHPTQVARTAVIVAALETASIDDLRRRSRGVLDTEAAAGVKRAVDHVERRLRSWFRTTGRRLVERRVGQIKDVARRSRFADATARTATFLETELPDPNVYLHVIAGPEPKSTDSAATLFGNHFVVEVVDATTADGIVEGATHELTHYLYDRVPVEKHLALIESLCRVCRAIGCRPLHVPE